MEIYKFGGASLKDAASVQNAANIIRQSGFKVVVVCSAMGKITNALEALHHQYFNHLPWGKEWLEIESFHAQMLADLYANMPEALPAAQDELVQWQSRLHRFLSVPRSATYDFVYDQIVSVGELLSSVIFSRFLNNMGIANTWLDIREHILTDTNYRYAKLNWEISQRRLELAFSEIDTQIVITQGFLGATTMGHTTTLGREGSDFTAAALAYMLDAKQVTVWKDVDGVYNADPKCYDKPQKLDQISYNEAIELAFFGAQVIHPKTIKPLQNKNIPLFVRSFLDTELQGTTIHDIKGHLELPPIFIHKKEQVLISIQPNDFSFIVEENLSKIFATFAQNGIRTNLMQNAAISFSACFDYRAEKLDKLLDDLRANFIVKYNLGLELITIRHYTQAAMDEMTIGRNVYLTQRSRHTVRFVLK
ncbi:MAG: hypothetical protein RIS47_2157 [Bacteroidota bacterium]